MMKSLQLSEVPFDALVCALYKHFPPSGHRMKKTPEELVRTGHLDQTGYARYKTWQKVCGLSKMEETKCRTCPQCRSLVQRDSMLYMVSLDGKFSSPVVDAETIGLTLNRNATVHKVPAPRSGELR